MAKGQRIVSEGGSWRVISQTAEYALRAVLYIARRPGDALVPVVEVARVLRVPERYLARVLNTLRRTGVLQSVRGAHGGFRLRLPESRITLLEVVGPFESVGEAPPCLLRGQRCGEDGSCSAHAAWSGVATGVRDFFQNTTIEDLMRGAATGLRHEPRDNEREVTMTAVLSADTTVNEAIRLYPQTVEVFNRFGIDACCGGGRPIVEAAARDGADPVALVRELLRVMREAA